MPSPHAHHWLLDPDITYLNHGSFGACPKVVLEAQQRYRNQLERQPCTFYTRSLQSLLDTSRHALAKLIGAQTDNLVFVRNATSAVNAVLRSLPLGRDDELLITDHIYNACRNAAEYVARRSGCRLVVAAVPFPVSDSQQIIDAIMSAVTGRTRVALIDHISSPTGMIFPVEQIVEKLNARGIDTLVDGAHGVGMVELDMTTIGAAWYTSNCHKWLCTPKGAAFLWARRDRQSIRPTVISHGANVPRAGYSRFIDEFDWPGTEDPTPWLCIADSIAFLESLEDGGLSALMKQNHELALAGRKLLCSALGIDTPCPDEMVGSIAAMPLAGDDPQTDDSTTPAPTPAIQTRLLQEFGIEVPVFFWPGPGHRQLRISAAPYNSIGQYERLAEALSVMK